MTHSDAIITQLVALRGGPYDAHAYRDALQSLRDLIRVEFAHDFIVDCVQVHNAMMGDDD